MTKNKNSIEQGIKNLIPLNRKSKEEVKRIARNGGIASGIAKRKRKAAREQIINAIDILTDRKLKDKTVSKSEKEILQGTDVLVHELVKLALGSAQSENNKLTAIQDLLNRVHGTATQKVEQKSQVDFKDMNETDIDTQLKELDSKIKDAK
jgi:hypothetical protein